MHLMCRPLHDVAAAGDDRRPRPVHRQFAHTAHGHSGVTATVQYTTLLIRILVLYSTFALYNNRV